MESITQGYRYNNLLSRILLKREAEKQFTMPPKPPKAIESFLTWYEKHFMNIDLSQIKIDRPIFMIGLPRSGTSMTQDIICTHPHVAYVSNMMNALRNTMCAADHFRKKLNLGFRGERFLKDSVEVDLGTPSDAIGFWAELGKYDLYNLDYVERKIEDFTEQEIDKMKDQIKRVLWCFGGHPHLRFYQKNPGLTTSVSLLNAVFPDAKFIHLVRDPRMTVNSYLKLYKKEKEQLDRILAMGNHGHMDNGPFIPYLRLPKTKENIEKYGLEDIRTPAHVWNDTISWLDEKKNGLGSFFEIRYEDILENPEDALKKIFEFMELPLIEENNQDFLEKIKQVGTIQHKNDYGNFEMIEEICRDNMKKYGYI